MTTQTIVIVDEMSRGEMSRNLQGYYMRKYRQCKY